jgi:hypothetical protein
MLHFAVFGDVHGRIALMMTIARLWEHHGARRLSGVLQVGDMGAFPDHTRLDEATARMARDDADELGFASFCTPTDEGERYLGDGAPPVAFIRGNHEDFDYLAAFDSPSVDVLMTHAGPEADELRDGSHRLSNLARRVAPRAHLFGHHHVAVGPRESPTGGLLVGLDHLEFGRRGELRERSCGILTLDGESTSFVFLDEARDPWLPEVRRDTYRRLLPSRPPHEHQRSPASPGRS